MAGLYDVNIPGMNTTIPGSQGIQLPNTSAVNNYVAPNVGPVATANQQKSMTPAPKSSFYRQEEKPSAWYDPFSFGDYGTVDKLKEGFKLDASGNPVPMSSVEQKDMALKDLYEMQAGNLGTSWNDWANIGLGGLGVAMQLSMLPDQQDYLSSSVDALKQQTQNAEEAHNTKMANNASYGSAFSNA